MADILSLLENPNLDQTLKIENEFKLILVLLVDGGLDKNPRYLKNIEEYCKLFKILNLDYFTIRTHAPEQSAYNPVERSMSTLSEKLGEIILPVDHFGSHLDTMGNVTDSNLELRNSHYAGEKLCDLWQRDDIHGHKRNKTVEALLAENNRFLPPLTKDQDEMYSRLTCSICKRYFPTLAFLTQHKKAIHFSTTHKKPKINAITDNYLPLLPYVYVKTVLDL
ncbi:8512_t:CDS:2, partial [Gigaspora margarita]